MIIKDVFHSIKNGANIKQDKSSGGIPITRIETIVDNKFNFEKLGYSGINDETFSNYYLEEGDILMSHINSVSHLGKVAIFENRQEKIIHGMNLLCLKANTNIILPKYAYYFFRSPIFISSLIKITKKSVNQASFNISNLEKIKIKLPEKLEDQICIATVLSNTETLIKKRNESIALVDELLKSTFYNMFGQGDNSNFPIKSLNEVSKKITDGEHGTVKRLDAGKLYLMARNITVTNELDFKNVSYISDEDHNKIFKRCNPEENDLLMVCVGATIGKVALVPKMENFSIARSVALIKPDFDKINSRYLLWFFKTDYGTRQIKSGSNEAAQAGLYTGNLKKIKLPIPPIELQKQFAEKVEKAEVLKTHYTDSLLELENLFGSLSQRAFKGELDLSALRVLVEEEEYQNYVNDRTELEHFPEPKIIVEFPEKGIQSAITPQMQEFINKTTLLKKTFSPVPQSIQIPSNILKLVKQIEQINKMMAPFEKLPKIPESVSQAMKTFESIKSISSTLQERKRTEASKITWEEVNFQQVSNWIKNKYDGFHFNSEMLIRFLTDEHVTFLNYYSSEELKTNLKLSEGDDLKSYVFSALNNENPFIKLEQIFYDATKENIELDLHEEDYELIKDKEKSERSGVYFKIVE